MSAAEVATISERPIAQARMRGSGFLRSELRLVFGRRRNQLGLIVLGLPPIAISIAVKTSASRPGDHAPDFFNSITQNGLFVALAAMTLEMAFLLPLAAAAVAGDAIAGEASSGTLRYLLTVPAGRTRLLLVKFAGICAFVLAATMTVAVMGMVVGLILFGGGSMTSLSGSTFSMGSAIVRVLFAAAYLALGICALGAVGLFISTLTEQPIAALLATVVFSTASVILDSIPQVAWIQPYLLTHPWTAFSDLFRSPIYLANIEHGIFVAIAYIVISGLAAWARFSTKDVSS